MSALLDTQITQQTIERNFVKLNSYIKTTDKLIAEHGVQLTDEQKARIKAMNAAVEKVNQFIEQRIVSINDYVDRLISEQQALAESINTDIRKTITDVETAIRADTSNAVAALDQAKVNQTVFSDTVNQLTQVDNDNRSIIDQVPGKITLAVGSIETKLNATPATSYDSIAALKIEADNLSAVVAANKTDADGKISTLTSDVNLVPGKITAAVTDSKNDIINNQITPLTNRVAAAEIDVNGIHTTVAANKTDADGKIQSQATRIDQLPEQINLAVTQLPTDPTNTMPNLSNLRLSIEGLNSTVSNQSGDISALQQRSGNIEATVANKASAADLQITNNSISAILTELGKSPETCAYAAITLLKGLIDLCVRDKDLTGADVVTRLNLSPAGVRIIGKLLHITGDTIFDDNVIIGKMLQAGSISVDKIDYPGDIVEAGKSLTARGYLKLSNGFIIQWGSKANGIGTPYQETFAIPFTTICAAVIPSLNSGSDGQPHVSDISNTGCLLCLQTDGGNWRSAPMSYIAVGF